MIRVIILCLLIFSFHLLKARVDTPIGARSNALANASLTLVDNWSVFHNQATLAFLSQPLVGLSYHNKFFLQELSQTALGIVLPVKSGAFGFSMATEGYRLYNETRAGLAYGKKLGEFLSFGVQLNYFKTSIAENYGKKGAALVEAGISAKLTDNLIIASHLFNPTRAKLSNYYNERLPTIMRMGIQYLFSEKTFMVVEVEKQTQAKGFMKFALEYLPHKDFSLRTGLSFHPFISSFGLGFKFKSFQLNMASTYHAILGHRPQLDLSFPIRKK